jgi:hypothetical protein
MAFSRGIHQVQEIKDELIKQPELENWIWK